MAAAHRHASAAGLPRRHWDGSTGQKAAAALDSVTDHVEEKEISGASKFFRRKYMKVVVLV